MKKTYDTGLKGESVAEKYLSGIGMVCLERRMKTKCGEIDLIMRDGETIVFVEVKTRLSGQTGSGLLAVDYRKQKRLANGAMAYLMSRNLLDRNVRFDVVEVNNTEIIYVPDAFQPGGMMF